MTDIIKTWKERKGLLNSEPFRAFIGVEWEMQAEIDELRTALTEALAAQPVREPLNKSEWPKHPRPHLMHTRYSKLELDSYAMQVLAAHGIGGEN